MEYDLAIIGAGWAGFNAAQKAKQSGLATCLIEKERIGGTCLNLGCIPTKALIQSAKTFTLIKKSGAFGIETQGAKIDFARIQQRKDRIIQQLAQGMNLMLKGVDLINAEAEVISGQEIKAGNQAIKARFILIATGSKPAQLPFLKFNAKNIISSDEILNLKDIPDSLLVVGGGVIGCEFASLFSSLGSKVCIIEKMPQLLPGIDKEAAKKIETAFKKRDIQVHTDSDAGAANQQDYSLILVCVGRNPSWGRLDLRKSGINTENGRIITDECMRTGIKNIYAAGDCTARIMLAHFAAHQGILAVENMLNIDAQKKINYAQVPSCIFTEPEVACVGLSEEEAKGRGLGINIHKFDFMGSGMARILEETEGFVKIISEAKTGEVAGAAIVGPKATELIGIITLAVSSRLKVSQLKDTIFAHPTLSESIGEALK